MQPEPKIVSFVLRFVYEEPEGTLEEVAEDWYSVIRHVQSDTEHHFTTWNDIVSFISRYVDITNAGSAGAPQPPAD